MLKPCAEWNERISAYLDGELNGPERTALEAHLHACDTCRTAVELYRCDQQDAGAALQVHGASEHFAAQVMQQITSEGKQPLLTTEIALEPRKRPFRPRFLEWTVVATLLMVFVAILFPTLPRAREKARQTPCTSNQRQLALAAQMYAQEHGQQLPSAEGWVGELDVPSAILRDPTAKHLENAYAYNHELSRKHLDDVPSPHVVPLTFDAINGRPDYRHSDGIIMSYVDGHVSYQKRGSDAGSAGVTGGGTKSPSIFPPVRNYGLTEKLLIAYRANMTLESADVQGSMEDAEESVNRHEGFVLSSDYRRDQQGGTIASVSGWVPSAKLGALLVEWGQLGTVTARAVNGEDLTAQHLEQWQQLEDLAGSQQNLRDIGKHASSTNGRMSAEEQRSQSAREASRLRVEDYRLKSRTTLAEVTLEIRETTEASNAFAQSASGALRALGLFFRWLLTIIIPVIIWLPIWGPVVGLVVYLRRRRRRKTGES